MVSAWSARAVLVWGSWVQGGRNLTWCHPHHCASITLAETVASRKRHNPFVHTVSDQRDEAQPREQSQLVVGRISNQRSARDQDDGHREQRRGQEDGE